jgi:hypothetical protein
LGADEAVSDVDANTVLDALKRDAGTSLTATHILTLVGRLQQLAISQHKDVDHVCLSIGGSSLFHDDLLTLCWVQGYESAAYVGNVIIKPLLEPELGDVPWCVLVQ